MNQSTLELQLNLGETTALAWKAEGLTQGELAEKAGLSRATVANIESGGADPKLSTIAELAKALDISPAWLFMSEEDIDIIGEISTSEEVSKYRDMLSDDLVNQISTMIRSGGKKRLEMALNSLQVAFQSDEEDSSEEEEGGLAPSKTAKLAAKASSSFAALGTKLSPGVGTAIGAAWAKIRSDSTDDSEGQWTEQTLFFGFEESNFHNR